MRFFEFPETQRWYNIVANAAHITALKGGVTISTKTGNPTRKKSGYYVGVGKLFEGKMSDLNFHSVVNDLMNRDNVKFVGGWKDEKTGNIYIDVVDHFESLVDAVIVAKANNEKAVWDIAKDEEIRLD